MAKRKRPRLEKPRLYHLTAEPWWILMAQSGAIYSRIDKERHGLAKKEGFTITGPDGPQQVVMHHAPRLHPDDEMIDGMIWLTENPEPVQLWQQPVTGNDTFAGKGAIRIEVDVPEAERWLDYLGAHGHELDPLYMAALNHPSTAGAGQPPLWWVTPGPIPAERWVKVTRTRDGLVLYERVPVEV